MDGLNQNMVMDLLQTAGVRVLQVILLGDTGTGTLHGQTVTIKKTSTRTITVKHPNGNVETMTVGGVDAMTRQMVNGENQAIGGVYHDGLWTQ